MPRSNNSRRKNIPHLSSVYPYEYPSQSTLRRRKLELSSADAVAAMRPCRNCIDRSVRCRITSSDSDKCVHCQKLAISCDLVVSEQTFDRLNAQMQRLWDEIQQVQQEVLDKAAKQQRLTKQLNLLRARHQNMLAQETLNIEGLEQEERVAAAEENPESSVAHNENPVSWDVSSETFVVPESFSFSQIEHPLSPTTLDQMIANLTRESGTDQVPNTG